MVKNFGYIRSLPEETLIYDGHEYTLQNLTFGAGMEPEHFDQYRSYYNHCKNRTD